MNSGKHHFLISGFCQAYHLRNYIFLLSGTDSSSGIGNNAITAKLITTILDFNIGSGMFHLCVQTQFLIFGFFSDFKTFVFYTCHIIFQNLYNLFFLIITDYHIDSGFFHCCFLCCLGVASCSHYYCIRIFLFCPMQHLTGFPVRHVGNRTGINHINICVFMKLHNGCTLCSKQCLHSFCLVRVDFTA